MDGADEVSEAVRVSGGQGLLPIFDGGGGQGQVSSLRRRCFYMWDGAARACREPGGAVRVKRLCYIQGQAAGGAAIRVCVGTTDPRVWGG